MRYKTLDSKKILTVSVFVGVIAFVSYILLSVYLNTKHITDSIMVLRSQERLALTNLDKSLQKLKKIKESSPKEKTITPE